MNFLAGLGLVVIALPLMLVIGILSLMWRSWWLYPAWAWFVVPLGLPAITFWHFAAVIFLISTLTTHNDTKKDDRPMSWPAVATMFMWPVIAWITLRWMR